MSTKEWREANKEKMREYRRKHYHENKEPYLERSKQAKIIARDYINTLKNTLKCIQCNENHPAVLDFHHLDSNEKEITVAKATSMGWSIKRIESEIAKCIVLCSNCHRKLHYENKA